MNSSAVVRLAPFLLATVSLSFTSLARAEVVVLQSGFDEQNSVPWNYGQPDVGLTYTTNGAAGLGFANTFAAADFAAAQSGPNAYTKAPLTQGSFQVYVPSLFAPYPLAQWVNIVSDPFVGRSMLYAMPFQLTTTNITSGSLSLKWAVDDFLGDPLASDPNPIGVYLNGQPVPTAISGGDKMLLSTALDSNIGPLLQTGQNWIYFYQRDAGATSGPGASGLMFGATITVVPEPATLVLLMCAAAGWCLRRRRAA
jgi:PEP-CTERM motif